MESCLLVCRLKKPKERKGKIIFIDARNEVRLERSNAWLEPQHIKKIADTYWKFKGVDGFGKVVGKEDVLRNYDGNLSVQLYVKQENQAQEHEIENLISDIKNNHKQISNSVEALLSKLKSIGV